MQFLKQNFYPRRKSGKLFSKLTHRQNILARISWALILAITFTNIQWNFSDFDILPAPTPKAEAQAADQTILYFKNDTATSSAYYDITGPNNEESSYTDGNAADPTGKTTAIAMHPIFGALIPTTTTDNVNLTTSRANMNVWYRTFIMPLANNTTFNSTTTFNIGVSADENNAAANAVVVGFVYVYDGDENPSANVQTLAGPTASSEVGTGNQGLEWDIANGLGAGSYTTDTDDYLAVELWVNFPTTTARNVTLRWGGNVVVAAGTGNIAPASRITINGTKIDTFDPLFFRETSADRHPTNETTTELTPEGGTLDSRRMGTVAGSSAETNAQDTTASGEWLLNVFTSPPLAAQTIPASSNFIIKLAGNESNASANAQFRYSIYTWDADDTIGDTIVGFANSGVEWLAADTTDNQVEIVVNNGAGAITISDGERLVIELNTTVVNSYTITHYFGGANTPTTAATNSALIPPLNSDRRPLQYLAQEYDQANFWFDEDDEDHTSSDVHSAWTDTAGSINENQSGTYTEDTNFRVRIQIVNLGGETDTLAPTLYYCDFFSCSYAQVTDSSTDVQIAPTANIDQNDVTTRQLTEQTPGWDFSAGRMVDTYGVATTSVSMTAWTYTEYEWSITAINPGMYNLKVRDGSTELTYYSSTAFFTAQEGSSLGVTAPTNVTLTTGNPGTTSETTFGAGELVAVTYGSAGWSLTVSSSVFTGSPTLYVIPAANVKLRTDGIPPAGGSDTYTIWSGVTTNVSEPSAGTYSLDTAKTVGTRSSGTGGDVTNVRPTIQIVIPPDAVVEEYTGDLTFTVA